MTRRALLIASAFVALLGASSCAAYFLRGDPWSGDLIKVPHDKHGKNDVACVACHEDASDAKDLAKTLRPAEAKCMECHQEEKDKGNCVMCHTDVKKARPYPARDHQIQLSHADHLKLVKDDCSACHKKLPEPTRARDYAPAMSACLGCHEHKKSYDEGRCDVCHKDLSIYALKPVADFSHRGDWVREHKHVARSSTESCALCHEQTYCADCHAKTVAFPIEIRFSENVLSDYIHRGDYVTRHSIDAQADTGACRRCHGTSFCENCHQAQNLTTNSLNPRNPHPPGWSFPGSAQFHGVAARQDIASCAACHDQGAQSNCVNCHKVGGVGGNPHPPGWTDRHPTKEINQNGMCRYCHI